MDIQYSYQLRADEATMNPILCKIYAKQDERKSSGSRIIDKLTDDNGNKKSRRNYSKLAKRSPMKAVFPLFILSLFIIYISFLDVTDGSPKHYCLRHCHMCNEMYGRHFMVHLCKDDCMQTRGRLIPDCLDLNSIRDYLDLTD